nr:gliding motility-associated C-terminal domain-containing protein [Allomuricauda sp.]
MTSKNIFFFLNTFLFLGFIQAQTALYNSGNLRIHTEGNLGFHTDLINDVSFEDNQGLAGFYGETPLSVQGSIPPSFNDVEFLVASDLLLQNTINVRNNANFIGGNVLTPKTNRTILLNFTSSGFFTGENDGSKVVGFAAVENSGNFSFPVGDSDQLRPLLLDSEGTTPLAICAYFFENPSSPTSITENFNTEDKVRDIGTVSDREFWILESNVSSTVTISWNPRSNLANIPNATIDDIIIVGWSKQANRWIIIGNSSINGDLAQGFLVSQPFVPNEYAAITFGTLPLPTDTFAVNNPTLGNYFLSPNGDGTNDFLVIEGMEESPNNSLRIFNRFGQKVYEKINYVDEFTGMSNTGSLVFSQDIGLPEGIYYYLVTLDDLGLEYQGFLFLDR